MKIQMVGGAGLHRSETETIDLMVEKFPDSWFCYAGLVVADTQGSMEIDALVITADRLLLVELKEWNGTITYDAGKWLQNGKPRGKSPYQVKRTHALRLRKLLEQELSRKLGYTLHVEAHVVLCGNAGPENLPLSEQTYVHTRDEFLKISKPVNYEKLVQKVNIEHLFETNPRPNSQRSLPIIQSFFDGPKVKELPLEVNGYVASRLPIFPHPNHVYQDYSASDDGYHALLRRWNFNALGVTNAEQSIWAEVAMRETRIGRSVRDSSPTIQDYLLRSISKLSEEDVIDDTRELYELRRTFKRLDTALDSEADKWTKAERIDRVRALLVPFSELHSLGIGHQDIDSHNLWYAEDQRSIVLTGFGAAYQEGRDSLDALRTTLQSVRYTLPEDAFDEVSDPYRMDVFMLAVLAYRICFYGEELPYEKTGADWCVPEWCIPEKDPFDGSLNNWFEQALHIEPSKRFPRADIMLSEFNSATKEQIQGHDENNLIFQDLKQCQFYREGMNILGLIQEFPAIPEEMTQVIIDLAGISNTGSAVYGTMQDHRLLHVKVWDGVVLDPQQPGTNRRINSFKQRIDKLAQLSLPTPSVFASGLIGQGGLYVVTEVVNGPLWSQFIVDAELDDDFKVKLAEQLILTVHQFHEKQLAHGDLCPDKVIVQLSEQDESKVALTLLGFLEYGDAYTAGKKYQPTNVDSTDAFGRDCFAIYRIVAELFGGNVPATVQAEIRRAEKCINGIPIALEPLLKSLREPTIPNDTANDEVNMDLADAIAVCWRSSAWPQEVQLMEPSDGVYYFSCDWSKKSKKELVCYITGASEQLQIFFEPDSKTRNVSNIFYHKNCSLEDTIRAAKFADSKIEVPLSIQRGSLEEGNSFFELIMGLDPVVDAIVQRYSCDNELDENDFEINESSPVELWQALSDTEGDLRELVRIDSASYQESPTGCLLYPYIAESCADLSFEFDETIIVYIKDKNESTELGKLNITETTANTLAINFNFDLARKRIFSGCQLQLESIRNKSSRELRTRALTRVIENKSEIKNLPQYFDYNNKPTMQRMEHRPTESELRGLYDKEGQEFNDQQLAAFQQLVEFGPVGVLQGPPGTGKTTFISKFIHYLYHSCGVKNILLVGQSHTAVDNVAIKAREVCQSKGMELDTVRIGQAQMIDESMLNVETKALQRQIQHKFHREYDLRVAVLGKRLGMAPAFIEKLCQLHRTLNPLMVSFAQCRRELNKLNKYKSESQSHLNRVSALSEQYSQLEQRAKNIVRTMFDSSIDDLTYDTNLIPQLANIVALQRNYSNPDNLDRFLKLLDVSQEWMDVLRGGEAGFDRFMLKSKQLVCGTLVGVGRRRLELAETSFDWVIVDEAGRAQAAELMVAIQSGRRVLLVGDHKQLPPFYHQEHLKLAAKKLELGRGIFYESDFERAFKATGGVTLDTQYRMAEPIGNIVSECFYAKDIGKLHSERKASPHWYSELPKPWNSTVTWVDSTSCDEQGGEKSDGDGRYYNQREVDLLMESLQRLATESCIGALKQTITTEQPYPIGIITMYNRQKDAIDSAISRAEWAKDIRSLIKIDTVDSYQGQENQIIILSLVRDNLDKLQGFLRDAPRINVAISRAQERLLILGASRMWEKENNDSALGAVHELITNQAKNDVAGYQLLFGQDLLGARE
ncbi:NERD domain-containing protein [Vibrio harveyi]|nr:NERD domain-containing protein [Vibrio harveyi]